MTTRSRGGVPVAAEGRRRVAIVTGGSRGIGAQIVHELVQDGTRVCFTYRSDDTAARAVVRRTVDAGIPQGDVLAVRADVTDEAAMGMVFATAETLGRVEVLVNNAGSTGRIATFAEGDNDEARRVIDVNLMAPILACRLAARRWGDDGCGRCIVNISSAAATLGAPGEYIPTPPPRQVWRRSPSVSPRSWHRRVCGSTRSVQGPRTPRSTRQLVSRAGPRGSRLASRSVAPVNHSR